MSIAAYQIKTSTIISILMNVQSQLQTTQTLYMFGHVDGIFSGVPQDVLDKLKNLQDQLDRLQKARDKVSPLCCVIVRFNCNCFSLMTRIA